MRRIIEPIAAIAVALGFLFLCGMLQAKDEYITACGRLPERGEKLIITTERGQPVCQYHQIISYGMAVEKGKS